MFRSRELTPAQTRERIAALRRAGVAFSILVRGSVRTRDDGTVWQAEGWTVSWDSLRASPIALIDGERVPFSPQEGARFVLSIEGWV